MAGEPVKAGGASSDLAAVPGICIGLPQAGQRRKRPASATSTTMGCPQSGCEQTSFSWLDAGTVTWVPQAGQTVGCPAIEASTDIRRPQAGLKQLNLMSIFLSPHHAAIFRRAQPRFHPRRIRKKLLPTNNIPEIPQEIAAMNAGEIVSQSYKLPTQSPALNSPDQWCPMRPARRLAAIQAISANLALGFRLINSHAEVNSSIPPYKNNIQRWEIEKKRSGWSKTAVGLTAVIRLNAAATKKVIAA
jgi:hypothetical protein